MDRRSQLHMFSLCLVWTSVTAITSLKDIKDLNNNTASIKEFPRHGLMLLYWFANNVAVDPSGSINLNFEPVYGSYGIQCYKTKTFDQNPESQYYILGDLSRERARMFPAYISQDFHNSVDFLRKNTDRMLMKVRKEYPTQVEKVYLTEHLNDPSRDAAYELDNTYEISAELLSQIQSLGKNILCDAKDPRLDFTMCEFLSHQQKADKVLKVYPKMPGFEWFLSLAGYNIDQRFDVFSQISFCLSNQTDDPTATTPGMCTSLFSESYIHQNVKLQIKSTSKGNARMRWSGIPESVASANLNIGLYKNGTTAEPLKDYLLNGRTYGSIETAVPLNAGLQVRIHKKEKIPYYYFFKSTSYTAIWKGPEFDEVNGAPSAPIRGYDASLRLYVRDGYACARIYIKKSFTNWKNVMDNSWVGFYANEADDNKYYQKYAWSIHFDQMPNDDCPMEYDIYEYESSLHIAPGVQARFMLTSHYGSEKARTAPWE